MAAVQLKAIVFFAHLLLVCLLVRPIKAGPDIHYCDKKANYDVKVSGVEISPYPVERGEPATFSIAASSDRAVVGGKLKIDVSYFGIHIHSETHDLCQETTCPVSAGSFVISHGQDLPIFTPPGSYNLRLIMEDENKHQLTCIAFDFSIGFLASDGMADH